MEMEELEITIPRDGTIQVRVKGMAGGRCVAATKDLEKAAGSIIARNITAEYFNSDHSIEIRENFTRNGD